MSTSTTLVSGPGVTRPASTVTEVSLSVGEASPWCGVWPGPHTALHQNMRKFSCSSPTSRDMSRHRPGRGLGNISKLELTMFVDICLDLEGSSPLARCPW